MEDELIDIRYTNGKMSIKTKNTSNADIIIDMLRCVVGMHAMLAEVDEDLAYAYKKALTNLLHDEEEFKFLSDTFVDRRNRSVSRPKNSNKN